MGRPDSVESWFHHNAIPIGQIPHRHPVGAIGASRATGQKQDFSKFIRLAILKQATVTDQKNYAPDNRSQTPARKTWPPIHRGDALIEMFNQAQGGLSSEASAQAGQKTDIIEIVAEKFERRLAEEISGVNHRIEQLRAEIKEDIASLDTNMHTIRAELIEKISVSHADIIKWMFIFWVGQVVTIVGILFVFFG